jgi:hypothetical protein
MNECIAQARDGVSFLLQKDRRISLRLLPRQKVLPPTRPPIADGAQGRKGALQPNFDEGCGNSRGRQLFCSAEHGILKCVTAARRGRSNIIAFNGLICIRRC